MAILSTVMLTLDKGELLGFKADELERLAAEPAQPWASPLGILLGILWRKEQLADNSPQSAQICCTADWQQGAQ